MAESSNRQDRNADSHSSRSQYHRYRSRHSSSDINVSEDDEIVFEGRDDEVYNLREWLYVSFPNIYLRRREHEPNIRHDENPADEVGNGSLRQQVMLDSGLISVAIIPENKRSKAPSIIKLLKNRQIGTSEYYRRKSMSLFTEGDLCRIASRFIPNRPSEKCMNKFDGKVFLGFYSKDGTRFLNSSDDSNCRYIRIYDTRAEEFTLLNRVTARDVAWAVIDADLSPDCGHFIYSSWCDSFHMCNMDNGEQEAFCITSDSNSRFCIFSLRFSNQGDKVLCGTNDNSLYIYDLHKKHLSIRINAHADDVNSVAFADAGSRIIYSASDDGLCKIWDIRCLNEAISKPEGILAGHRHGITFIDPRDDGHHLITNGKDQCIKLWDLRKPSLSSNVAPINCLFDHRNDYGNARGTCYDRAEGDASIMTLRGHEVKHTLVRARFSPRFTTGQRFVYTGCSSGNVVIYDLLTGKEVRRLSGHKSCVRDVSWHPSFPELVSSSWDNTIVKWTHDSNDPEEQTTDLRRSQRIALRIEEKERKRRRVLASDLILDPM